LVLNMKNLGPGVRGEGQGVHKGHKSKVFYPFKPLF
jgi:hypothetical protein